MRAVRQCDDNVRAVLTPTFARYRLQVVLVGSNDPIPGSHWGAPEAGLIGSRLYLQADTPVHSALHESCHYVCMDEHRRTHLDTDAGSDDDEETAVCYLSVLLSDHVPHMGRERMFHDMDAWGYSFRLGSAKQWFERDASEARLWLARYGIIDADARPTWRLRY